MNTAINTVANDLELVSVSKHYGATVAVDSIDYRFRPDSYTCLLGPSGCGKSSTLRMIAGHESVSKGAIFLGGCDISILTPAQRGTAMMFQNYALFPHLNVLDNVAFSLKMKGVDLRTRHAKAYAARRGRGTPLPPPCLLQMLSALFVHVRRRWTVTARPCPSRSVTFRFL